MSTHRGIPIPPDLLVEEEHWWRQGVDDALDALSVQEHPGPAAAFAGLPIPVYDCTRYPGCKLHPGATGPHHTDGTPHPLPRPAPCSHISGCPAHPAATGLHTPTGQEVVSLPGIHDPDDPRPARS